jgi:glycosyltransferase involved in cell wall biosynthesis
MRIACIIDTNGKVQHNRIRVLREYITDATFQVFLPDQKIPLSECDVLYYANAGLFEQKRVKHPHMCGSITSHKPYRKINVFDRISVNNRMLYDEYKQIHRHVTYIPNGVRQDVFTFEATPLVKPFRIGWVGNVDRSVKNHDILVRLMERFNDGRDFKFDIVGSSKKDGAKQLHPLRKMVPYYQRLNFFLVTSTSEGTPNPALEAASCGVPLISSYVGNMPELIDGSNGWLAPRKGDIYQFISDTLESLRKIDVDKYNLMRLKIRKDVEDNWTWQKRMPLFRDFFLKW